MRQMTLIEGAADAAGEAQQPLASRMRPRDLSEFVGQEHLVGEGKILRQMIERDQIPSLILWGPPGVGKTTLAYTASTRRSRMHSFPTSSRAP